MTNYLLCLAKIALESPTLAQVILYCSSIKLVTKVEPLSKALN